VTFWQAYGQLLMMLSKGFAWAAVSAGFGYCAGYAMGISIWLTVLLLLGYIATVIGFAAWHIRKTW
jgi:hypothetical protein